MHTSEQRVVLIIGQIKSYGMVERSCKLKKKKDFQIRNSGLVAKHWYTCCGWQREGFSLKLALIVASLA